MKGGKRPGAGRPPQSGRTKVPLSCRVLPETKEAIREQRLNIGQLIDKMIKGMQ